MRIVILDGHPICRAALGDLLRNRFSGADLIYPPSRVEAQRIVADGSVDLIVADMQTDDVALGGLSELIDAGAGAPTIAMDAGLDPARSAQAHLAGARAYVSKAWSAEMIEAVIAVAAAGGRYFLEHSAADREGVWKASLTGRQSEVLDLMLKGHNNREICQILDIALPTVKIHVTSVLRALGVRNRSEALALARRSPDGGPPLDETRLVGTRAIAPLP